MFVETRAAVTDPRHLFQTTFVLKIYLCNCVFSVSVYDNWNWRLSPSFTTFRHLWICVCGRRTAEFTCKVSAWSETKLSSSNSNSNVSHLDLFNTVGRQWTKLSCCVTIGLKLGNEEEWALSTDTWFNPLLRIEGIYHVAQRLSCVCLTNYSVSYSPLHLRSHYLSVLYQNFDSSSLVGRLSSLVLT